MPKQNVPALRLEGFDGEWEEKTIQQISVPVSRVNPNSTAPIMMISSADGFINQSEKYSSDNAGKSLSKYVELHQGELAYNHGASKLRPFGSCFELRETAARVPFVYHCFRVVEEHPTFTSYSLNRNSVQSQLERLVSSGARMDGLLNISFPQYGTVTTHFPTFEEQQAIGAIFTNLDAAINQHTLKHKSLQQSKTALMQRMFPQEGQTVPELRLEGFDGEWEEKRLVDEVSFFSGLTYTPSDVVEHDGTLVLRSSNVQDGVIATKDCVYVRTDAVNVQNVRKNDIIMVVRNGSRSLIGKHAVVQKPMPSTVIGAFMTGIRSDQPWFINALFDTGLFKYEVDKSMGATINQITGGMFAGMSFFFPPTLEEQQAIGAIFTKLDALIAAEAQYIKSLSQAKTALLQRMFI